MQLVPLCCQRKHPFGSCFPFHLCAEGCAARGGDAVSGKSTPSQRSKATHRSSKILWLPVLPLPLSVRYCRRCAFSEGCLHLTALFRDTKTWVCTQVCVFQGCDEPTTISVLRERLWKIDYLGKMSTRPISIYPWQAFCCATCLWRLLKI